MKTKWIMMMVLTGLAFNSTAGTIAWGSSDLGAGYTAGWLVALYEDVSKDGFDASMINIANGSTDSDDTYLGITSALTIGKSGTAWGSSFGATGVAPLSFNDRLYSVLFNAPTMAAATQYKVTTMTTQGNSWYALPATDIDGSYQTTTMGSFQAVPEPSTFLLFAMGGIGAWLIRRKQMAKV